MLDPNNGFSESSTSVIELKDDDTEAVLAVLRWIYGFGYYKFFGRDREAFSGINVYVAAGKYLRDGLRNVARDHLRNNMLYHALAESKGPEKFKWVWEHQDELD